MHHETALFLETVEQIYERVFQNLKPRTPLPRITIRFRKYANATSRIRLAENQLTVDISDLLERAPAPVQEDLARILLGKLYRKPLEPDVLARYRLYLNRSDIRSNLQHVKQQRGRKQYRHPAGQYYDLDEIFDAFKYSIFWRIDASPETRLESSGFANHTRTLRSLSSGDRFEQPAGYGPSPRIGCMAGDVPRDAASQIPDRAQRRPPMRPHQGI